MNDDHRHDALRSGRRRKGGWAFVSHNREQAVTSGGTMSEEHPPAFPTRGNGARYDYSAAAAAEILNLHFDPSQPKAVLYGRILFTILKAMDMAEEELARARWEPSEN